MKVHTIGVRFDVRKAMLLIIWSGFFGLYILPVGLSRTAAFPFISNETMAFTLWRMIFRNLLKRSNRFVLDLNTCGRLRAASYNNTCFINRAHEIRLL